jgi:hypothetical protein
MFLLRVTNDAQPLHGLPSTSKVMKEGDMDKPGKSTEEKKTEAFRERLGADDIEVDEYKVDDLRKIASEYDIAGSHDMHKEELVSTINKVRQSQLIK